MTLSPLISQAPATWGLRMMHIEDDSPVLGGWVAIGWHELGNLSNLPKSRDAFKKAYADTFINAKQGAIPVSAGQVFRFVHEAKVGDRVIYPSAWDRMIHIGTIASEYSYDPSPGLEYPHRRSVKWHAHRSRDDFSQSALNEINAGMTFFSVTRHDIDFLAWIDGAPTTPIVSLAEDEEETASFTLGVEESTDDFVLKRLKEAQTPYEFEHFIAHLLQCMGYHSRVTQASGDGGIDVIAHKDELGFEPPIIKVQCKQTNQTIDRPETQKLVGALAAGEMGLFVTLGGFSTGARTYEQTTSNLRLIDGRTLVDLIKAHYEAFSPKYQALIPLKQSYLPNL